MVILSIGFYLYIEAYLSGWGIQLAAIPRLMRKALHRFQFQHVTAAFMATKWRWRESYVYIYFSQLEAVQWH